MTPAFLVFLAQISIRTAIVLVWLALGLRLLGKRQLGQMNIYDLAMIMALANSVQNAMTSGKGELAVGIASAGTLIVAGRLLSYLFVRSPQLERRLVGNPLIVIHDGQVNRDNMRRAGLTLDLLQAALRQHMIAHPNQVRLAVMEVDGTLSVIPRDDADSS